MLSNTSLSTVLEALPDAVIVVDGSGRIVLVNRQAERLFGYAPDELLGLDVEILVPSRQRGSHARHREAYLEAPVVRPMGARLELFGQRKDGSEFPVEISLSPLQSEHGVLVVSAIRDITERKAPEDERRQLLREQEARAEAEVLAALAGEIHASLDLDRVLQRVAEAARHLCAADVVRIALPETPGGAMVYRYLVGTRATGYEQIRIVPGPGFAGRVLATGRPYRAADAPADEAVHPVYGRFIEAEGVRTVMVVPIGRSGGLDGLIYVARRTPRPFTEHDERTCSRLAAYAAIAMENARIFGRAEAARAEAEAAAARFALLADASRLLAGSLQYRDTVAALLARAVPTLGDWAEAYLASRDGAFRRIGPVCVDPAAAAAARAVREMQPPVTWASGPNPALDTQLEGRPLVLADVPDGWLERHLVGDEYIRLLRGAPPRSLMLAPLIARGRTIGSLLFVSTRGGRAYDDADVALALDLGRRAGAAIDSARLVVRAEAARADAEAATEESRRQAARLRMLLHLTHTISSSLDSRTVLSEVAGAAAELTGARLVSIWIADESSRTLRPVAFNDEQLGRSHPADTLRYGEGGIGWVAAHRKPLVVPDIGAERRFVARPWFRGQGLTSAMELPILFGDSLLGVIGFFGERPFEQRPEIREMLDGFLAQAALAMRNARMYEDALRRQERTAFLAEAGALLASSLEYERTLVDLTRLVVPRLADSCALDMVAGGAIRRLAVAHVDAAKEALVRELRERYGFNPDAPDGVPRVVRTGEPAFVPHVTDADLATAARTPEQLAILRSLGMRSWIIVPLVARERILGAITLVTADSGRTFDAADLELARDLARLAAIAIDNAELYRAAQEANRAKDEFLATLSHELRTPLNSVLGWARMLRAGQLAEAARARALEVIERNAMAQAELIEDLLDVSRIITGKLRLEVHSVDPAVAVRAALDVVSPSVDAKQIRLETALASDAGMILADPDRLRQVVLNLLANAVKFTASGGTIRVSLARVDDGVEIQVSDTGEGIEPGALPYIFDRFRQADSTTTRKHGGLGLGLALVRHLVDLHGGSVEARSEGAGKGATFVVRLPSPRGAVGASDVREADVAAVPPQGTPRLEGVRVLVVDDDTDSLELVRVVLRQAGAAVVTATSAAEALVALREARYEVVLTDVEMPGEDGYSFVRRLRATPGGARIPVVALTAYGRVEDRVRTKSAGFALHVAKPAQPEEIVAAVASVVDRGPARRVD